MCCETLDSSTAQNGRTLSVIYTFRPDRVPLFGTCIAPVSFPAEVKNVLHDTDGWTLNSVASTISLAFSSLPPSPPQGRPSHPFRGWS